MSSHSCQHKKKMNSFQLLYSALFHGRNLPQLFSPAPWQEHQHEKVPHGRGCSSLFPELKWGAANLTLGLLFMQKTKASAQVFCPTCGKSGWQLWVTYVISQLPAGCQHKKKMNSFQLLYSALFHGRNLPQLFSPAPWQEHQHEKVPHGRGCSSLLWQWLLFSLPRPLNSSKFQLKDKPLELLINGPFSQHFLKLWRKTKPW